MQVMHELSQIRSTGVTTSELAEGKGMLVGEFTMSIADPASLAQELAVRSLYGIPLDEIHSHVAAIEAVTSSEVIFRDSMRSSARVAISWAFTRTGSRVIHSPAVRSSRPYPCRSI